MVRVLITVARTAAVALVLLLCTQEVGAQVEDLLDRPISDITIDGLDRVDLQLVLNQIRATVGDPYDSATVRGDVRRLTRLGEFKYVDAAARLKPDGTVVVIYQLVEQALISEVQVVGNKLINDQDLRAVVQLFPRGPRDDFLIEQAKRSIENLYRERGHYLIAVEVDESDLEESGILIFRVIEGPRVRVRAIEFVGNDSIPAKELLAQIRTETYAFIFRKGELNKDVLLQDLAAIDSYYKDAGYLDVRVDRTIELSPDNTEAKVTFLIAEGRQFTLGSVRAINALDGGPTRVFAQEGIAAILRVKTGDVYSQNLIGESIAEVAEAYERLSYFPDLRDRRPEARIRSYPLRRPDEPVIDLLLDIDEGTRYNVGTVEISGNFLTRDNVIRRQVRLDPGRPFDVAEIAGSEERLRRTRLFSDARITVQDPRPGEPDTRDVLVEVRELNTGSVSFGLGFGSDQGAFGSLSVSQRNFDITDFPESFGELVSGRSFRGAGQQFNITVRPGIEIFEYGFSWLEPHMFETDYSFGVSGGYRQREYTDYDEERVTVRLPIGRRLGDIWRLDLIPRFERVELTEFDLDAPTAVFDDAGPNNLISGNIVLTRTTLDSPTRPSSGSRVALSYEYVGGDFNFSKVRVDYTVYFKLTEDFLRRQTTLRLTGRVGYIFGGNSPTYERFYLGGRTFRGFEFRTISPKGIQNDTGLPSDQPVGGEWLLFLGAQYQFPIFSELISGVFFVDSGTVTDNPGFDEYRLSIGAGLRLTIPAISPVPIALDLAVPLLSEDTDDEQVFSFSAEFPF